MIYAYGHKAGTSKDICVARVHKDDAADRSRYDFWNGKDWTKNISSSASIMSFMQHGQMFQTQMFGPGSPYGWAFVGCNAWGDNKMQMGRATSPQGPWDIHETSACMYWTFEPHGGFCYCVYPHPWADETEKTGDLTISWSEGGMTGGVLMSRIRLEMQDHEEQTFV